MASGYGLKGHAAIVTGSTSGIGQQLAQALAAEGVNVVLNGFGDAAKIEQDRAALAKSSGVTVLYHPADMTKPAEIADMVGLAHRELGRLDILVNGAAGNFICLAENLSPNGFGTVVDIDLKGTFNVSKAALPHLKTRGGSVLNISATLPYLGTMGQSHAAAAKAGIDSLTRVLACEWGPHKIRVNGIAPGPVEGTEGVRRLMSDQSRAGLHEECPLGRMATIDEIANAALYLSSDAASFVTGVTLVVDGGLWLRSARILG